MYVAAILAVWGIVITGVYLLRTMKTAWLGKMPARWEGLTDARTPFQRLPYLVLASVLLLFGFWRSPSSRSSSRACPRSFGPSRPPRRGAR